MTQGFGEIDFFEPSEHRARIEGTNRALWQFIMNPGLRNLADTFGFERQGDISLDTLTQLQFFANNSWDFRGGAERQDRQWVDEGDPALRDKIFEAAEWLEMVQSTAPIGRDYDFLVIPGAANQSPLLRLKYALEQPANYGAIVLMGCSRPLNLKAGEPQKVANYAPDATNEFDLMNASAERLLVPKMVDEQRFDAMDLIGKAAHKRDRWQVRLYEALDGTPIYSLYAPAIEGKDRANTADTYAFMRALAGDMLTKDTNILVSTNAFYNAFQHLDAVRALTLTTGARVETIGFSAEYAGGIRKSSELLQEINSAVNSAVMLRDAYNAYQANR